MTDPDFRTLFENAPALLLVLLPDAKFTIVGATDDYLAATRTVREQVLGRGLFEVFPDDADDPAATGVNNLRVSLQRVIATKAADTMAVQKYSIARPPEEGGGFEERHWSPRNLPVLDADGKLRYILHRVEDVTGLVKASSHGAEMEREVLRRSYELDAALRDLRAAHARQHELDRAKTEFFDNVSHEFRTPLTLLLAPSEQLLESRAAPLAPSQRELVQVIHRNGQRMLKLVNALLDFSRFGSGRAKATFVATDLAALTREVAHAFESPFARVGVALSIDCPPLSTPVHVDRDLWEKVVLNLVSNALKYTPAGTVAVRQRETATEVLFEVEDSGVGIPEHEMPHMFERFHRVAGTGSRSIEGTGIGLALVAEIAKAHGGRVTVRSTPGVGSCFTVTLPKGTAHLEPTSIVEAHHDPKLQNTALYLAEAISWTGETVTEAAPSATAASGRARVLVVDDNPDLRRMLRRLLEPHFEVAIAEDGVAGLELIRSWRPDLVLSDAMMPRLDGLGMLRAIRADPAIRSVPVILLSGRSEERTDAGEGGPSPDDYLMKPFSSQELIARVRKNVEQAQSKRRLAVEVEELRRERDELQARSTRNM